MATPVTLPAGSLDEPSRPDLGPVLAVAFITVGFVSLEILALALGWAV